MSDYFFLGQGPVLSAIRDGSGIPLGFTLFGNCSNLELSLGKNLSLYATGGSQTPANAVRSSEPPSLTMNIENISSANLAMLIYGINTAIAAGSVASETVIGYLDKVCPLAYINLSSFTSLTHSSGSPTYVRNTDYTVDLKNGAITPLSTGAISNAQSLRANYVRLASTKVAAGTIAPPFQALRFHGLNVASSLDPVVVDVYKVRFYPIDNLPLIADKHASLKVSARIFYDPVQSDTTTDGRLVRIRKV